LTLSRKLMYLVVSSGANDGVMERRAYIEITDAGVADVADVAM